LTFDRQVMSTMPYPLSPSSLHLIYIIFYRYFDIINRFRFFLSTKVHHLNDTKTYKTLFKTFYPISKNGNQKTITEKIQKKMCACHQTQRLKEEDKEYE